MAQRSTATQKTAATAVTQNAAVAVLQRQCACGQHSMGGECEGCKKKISLSRDRQGPASGGAHVLDAIASSGRPLDPETRSMMESRFEHDFSAVRLHTDARAEESAR